jgi:hypothetical protein
MQGPISHPQGCFLNLGGDGGGGVEESISPTLWSSFLVRKFLRASFLEQLFLYESHIHIIFVLEV